MLEQRAVRRVGGATEEPVDVLVICGGQESPNQMLERGRPVEGDRVGAAISCGDQPSRNCCVQKS